MGQLIDALLQLSRLSRADFETAPVNLSELAQSIADELTAQEPERSVTCKIESGLTTNGDERLLRVALTNLLSNAWKFTSQKAHSCIEFGSTEHNGISAYFVRDNGVGFDMAYANKLVGAFQRLHRS